MKTKDKFFYVPPTSEVMEMNTQGVVCASAPALYLFLTDDPNSAEIDWGRDGYGSATTDTWN